MLRSIIKIRALALVIPIAVSGLGFWQPVAQAQPAASNEALIEGFPSVEQWYNLDCEYAAAAAVTLYWNTSGSGGLVSQRDFLREVPTSPNPHLGFRGDINAPFGGINNYGVYAEALVPVLERHGYNAVVFYGGLSRLKSNLAAGNPVVVWITTGKYVERPVYDQFVHALLEKASRLNVGDPLKREVYMGPVINEKAVQTFENAVADVKKAGGRVLLGGERIKEGDLGRGLFVQPTVVEAPLDSRVWKDELFVPFVAVAPVDSIDQALELANKTEYGLTAGFYSEDPSEQQKFLDRIQAGVVYVNRRAGATTGAWPGMQPFGGWKGSGTTGKAGGGLHYVQQYLREQSQTVIDE